MSQDDATSAPEEFELVGAAIMSPELAASIPLHPDDFYSGRMGALWAAIGSLHASGHPIDPIRLVDEAAKLGATISHGLVIECVGRGFVGDAEYYAEKIREGARRRRMKQALIRAMQRTESGDPLEEIIANVGTGLNIASPLEREVEKAMTLEEFVGQTLPATEWVIPGLLSKGDRLVLTGTEGAGKTQLMREIGIAAAGGRHPFTLDAMEPRRVLYIDCENPLSIMVKTMSSMTAKLRGQGIDFGDRMWIKRFPQGIDLSKTSDRLMLHTLCRTFRPDVLMLGPVYKLCQTTGMMKDEDIARTVTMALDGLREEFGCCLILEHHSPHGQQGIDRSVRPIGSSLWLRWPEFGYGLRLVDRGDDLRHAEFIPWRGARDQRDWPRELVQGGLAWVAA